MRRGSPWRTGKPRWLPGSGRRRLPRSSAGQAAVQGIPLESGLASELAGALHRARQGQATATRVAAAREVHRLADRVRFCYGVDQMPVTSLRMLERRCRELWQRGPELVRRLRTPGAAALPPGVRDDLLDLAIFWADLQVRLAPPAASGPAQGQALAVLAQAETLLGPSAVLDAERQLHGAARPRRAKSRRTTLRPPGFTAPWGGLHFVPAL